MITSEWRGAVGNPELNALHAEGWLHVDFEEDLTGFYLDSCGFRPTPAGLIAL